MWKDTIFLHVIKLMNERQSLHHSQSKVVCRNFFGLWLRKHRKIRIAYRQWRSNSPSRGKTKIRSEKPKVTYSAALVMAFLAAENENRQLENMLQAAFGCLPERFLSVRTKSITETFECWKLGPLFVFVVIQSMFPSWALTPTHFTIFIRGLSILLFSFTNNVDFSCQ